MERREETIFNLRFMKAKKLKKLRKRMKKQSEAMWPGYRMDAGGSVPPGQLAAEASPFEFAGSLASGNKRSRWRMAPERRSVLSNWRNCTSFRVA